MNVIEARMQAKWVHSKTLPSAQFHSLILCDIDLDINDTPPHALLSACASIHTQLATMWTLLSTTSAQVWLSVALDQSAYTAGDIVRGRVTLSVSDDMIGDGASITVLCPRVMTQYMLLTVVFFSCT